MRMPKYYIAVAATLTLAGATAFGTVCKKGSDERKVEVVTTDPAKKVPCEVKYTRGGEEKAIYNAQNDATFCDKKAEEFVAKLSGQGFQCDGAGAGEAAAAPSEHTPENPEKKAEPVQEKK